MKKIVFLLLCMVLTTSLLGCKSEKEKKSEEKAEELMKSRDWDYTSKPDPF